LKKLPDGSIKSKRKNPLIEIYKNVLSKSKKYSGIATINSKCYKIKLEKKVETKKTSFGRLMKKIRVT
jgi:hypothetical protein